MAECKVRLGLIGGSGTLKSAMVADILAAGERKQVETPFGAVVVNVGALSDKVELVLVQRHLCDPSGAYAPPHKVNYRAIVSALKSLQACAVVGICSVGALKTHLHIGQIVIPDDYFCPSAILSLSEGHDAHHVPEISDAVRQELLLALYNSGANNVVDGGVYYNSNGPRFETKAEIRFMAQYGDVVGMTGAHEATLMREAEIPYAMLCAIDNMANGVDSGGKGDLSLESFYSQQEANKSLVERALHVVLKRFKTYPEVLREIGSSSSTKPGAKGMQDGGATDDVPSSVIHASYVVTVDSNDRVLENHAVCIREGKILEILPSEQADTKYGVFSSARTEIVRLPDTALMPGLINAHTHSPMTLMRGFGDDMHLTEWLTKKIWPAEVRCVSSDFVRDGARLACAEFIKGGTTCFNDMYFFPETVSEVIEESGMRGMVGAILIEFPSNYGSGAEDYLQKGEKMLTDFEAKGPDSRTRATVSPHSPYAVSDEHLVEAHKLAKRFNVPFHIHVHETEREVSDSEKGLRESQFCHNCPKACRPLKNLIEIGIVDEHFVAAHMCHLSDEEIELLAKAGAHVVHCPTSNMKLASGFCPVLKLLKAGVNVAIGTDGAASNNSLDMFAELKLAAILAKGVSGDPTALPAETALRLATINGAKALGLAHKTGSLELGKQADMVAVDLSDISSMPTYTVVSHLVYATGRHQVTNVWVDGKRLLRDKHLLGIDSTKVRRSAERWKETIEEVDRAHDGTF